jgi:hypothetical protein
MVFRATISEWHYSVKLISFTGVARVKVSTNVDVCLTVTLRGQNYIFSRSPRENLFNSIPDSDTKMLVLRKFVWSRKQMTEATYKPDLRPETILFDLERALSKISSLYKLWI